MLALIPARGGSKRIPRKNIKNFLGKPIIAYSIQVAFRSGLFSEIMVSTDDDEIASIAREYGASVPFMRSKENASDYATTADVITEVLTNFLTLGKKFKYVCVIYPTAPFITFSLLNQAAKALILDHFDSVCPVVKYSYPIQRSLIKDKISNQFRAREPQYLLSRSQDLEPCFHDAGQFYFLDVDAFIKSKIILNPNMHCIELEEMSVQDIDTEEDWKIAEMKYNILHERV